MRVVSAIPENLFKYSDACTRGAEQFQSWVRTVLAPAMSAFDRNAAIPCSGLDAAVAKQIAAAFYTDRDVRTVGQAFLEADGPTARKPGTPVGAPEKAVESAFQRLQRQYALRALQGAHQAQMNAGANLAKRLMNARPAEVNDIVKLLAPHANDPYFNAGFYNNLDKRHIETAMTLGGIPALVQAYSSGLLDRKVHDSVARIVSVPAPDFRGAVSLDDHYMSDAQKTEFLRSIGANPMAARNFLAWWPPDVAPPSGPAHLSYELWFAGYLPYPSVAPHGVAPDGRRYSREELAVLSWIELHKDIILREARKWDIDPRGIIAAISWEALKNVHNRRRPIAVNIPPTVPKFGLHSVGPGKVHLLSSLITDLEGGKYGNYVPATGLDERKQILASSEGSIKYIAAIMAAYSKVTDDSGHRPIRKDPVMLTQVFHGGGVQENPGKWREHLNSVPKDYQYAPGNDMAVWARQNMRFLDDALAAD
ncbi:hypothetical protein [Streptomyces cuspidosporus]